MRTQFNYLTCYWQLREGRAAVVMHGDADSSVAYLEPVTRAHKSPDGLGLVGYTAHATFRDALADARTFENFENAKGGA